MRQLITIALSLGVVANVAAQSQGEVIIRRPGVPDRVITLDSQAGRVELSKVQQQLRELTSTLQVHTKQLQDRVRTEFESPRATLALQESGRLSADLLRPLMLKGELAARRRPLLGVTVHLEPAASDKYGALIDAVTPGSPAERAGLISGDIITRLAGKSVIDNDPKGETLPGMHLISMIATLTPGKSVDVELRRGNRTVNAKITPIEETSSVTIGRLAPSIAEMTRVPSQDRMAELSLHATPSVQGQYNVFTNGNGTWGYSFGSNNLFSNVELTSLNEKLGSYFGATEGVLVVNVGMMRDMTFMAPTSIGRGGFGGVYRADSARAGGRGGRVTAGRSLDSTVRVAPRGTGGGGMLFRNNDSAAAVFIDGVPAQGRYAPVNIGLEPGDVIVSVDGRKVSNPSQLMRIVGTYEHNDEFKLQIMRQKRAETLTVKMP